ncbi:unnamed protein product [Echinostoma caproni]|uniref:Uncharacterized protein n=1 Tax=Echinostoma caproni TaxID=27848 RepID=A0A3P8JUI5_9TREM|nr:unnamed protein product [Echinostoma caproni]
MTVDRIRTILDQLRSALAQTELAVRGSQDKIAKLFPHLSDGSCIAFIEVLSSYMQAFNYKSNHCHNTGELVGHQVCKNMNEQNKHLVDQCPGKLITLQRIFHVPESQTPYLATQPHTDYIQPERLVASAQGLCDPDLLQMLATQASKLASLVTQMRQVQLEADRVFAPVNNHGVP